MSDAMEYNEKRTFRTDKDKREPNPLKPTFPKKPKKGLSKLGRRADRLADEDKHMSDLVHALPCICGCAADPTEGEVARAHLESRQYETTRNEAWNNLPACLPLSHWIDHKPAGVLCKARLLEMAQYKWQNYNEVLTHGDVWPLLDEYGFYGWRKVYGS